MNKLLFITACFLLICRSLTGQIYHVKGKVLDSQTLFPVPSASVMFENKVLTTGNQGSFIFDHPGGNLRITINKDNFEPKVFDIVVHSDTTLEFLFEKIIKIDEVKVFADRNKAFTRDNDLQIAKIKPSEFSYLPDIGSSDDILKKVQFMPGFQSAGEASSGLIVRGGQYDQNLFNIDGFPVYQLYHFSGFFSAVDPALISDVELMKGGFPARYSGKLSSVVNFIPWHSTPDTCITSIQAGIFMSGASVKFAPGDKSTVNLSARIGSATITKSLLESSVPEFPVYNFYDINFNTFLELDQKNELELVFFYNKDFLKKEANLSFNVGSIDPLVFKESIKSGWNDLMAGLKWNHEFNETLKTETNLYYQSFYSGSDLQIIDTLSAHFYQSTVKNKIDEIGILNNWVSRAANYKLNFGFNMNIRKILPENSTKVLEDGQPIIDIINPINGLNPIKQLEFSPYIEAELNINKNLVFRPGLRLLVLSDLKSIVVRPEPRIYLSYKHSDYVSFMSSYVVTTQSIQLLSSSNIMSTSDLWLPAFRNIKPALSQMVELGTFLNNGKFLSAEINLYYKSMKNLYNYKDGASFLIDPVWQNHITMTSGKSYGAEFLIQANFKRIFLLSAYTYSRTTRQSPELNDGYEFNYKYDRPHNFNITMGIKPTERINLSLGWTFQSGILYTFETRVYQRDFIYMTYKYPYIDKINNLRYPNYHRLDFGFEYKKPVKWGSITLKLDIYNVYNKQNPWLIQSLNTMDIQHIWQITLFPILPSLSLKIEF